MEFKKELSGVFEKYNLSLTEKQLRLFEDYFNLILEYNKNVNLTAITNQSDFILKHFLDSVLCVDEFSPNSTLIDVGAGAGFPSIPIAIMRPDIKITMVDGLNKRVIFLQSVINKLNLKNVAAIHDRCEALAHKPEHREQYDYCVARAVAGLNTLSEYCLPFVKIYGFFVAYKSKNAKAEIEQAKAALAVLGGTLTDVKIFDIEELHAERDFLFIQKRFKCPTSYPRGQNKPKLQPIQ